MYTITIVPNHNANLVAIPTDFAYNCILDEDGYPLRKATMVENITLRTQPILAWSIEVVESQREGIGPRVTAYPVVANAHRDKLAKRHYIVFDTTTERWGVEQYSKEDSGVGINTLARWLVRAAQEARYCAWLDEPWPIRPTDQMRVADWVLVEEPDTQQNTPF
jgi:hypothetical protein